MEDLQEVARLILLQVDYNRECGKDDKFTKDEIADIINRRVVKKLTIPAVINSLSDLDGKTMLVKFKVSKFQPKITLDEV
jgi:hypothetical protein